MLQFRCFEKSDWMSFSGSESFSCDSDPVVSEMEIDGISAVVVVDRNGVYIEYCKDDVSMYANLDSSRRAHMKVFSLKPSMTLDELKSLGFLFEEC